jgi:hypothetical protein
MRENKGWYQEGLTHEQLVAGLQAYIHNFQQVEFQLRSGHPSEKQEPLAPEAVVRQKLDWESGTEDPEKGEYYATLRYAWDALSYDRLKPGSLAENLAGSTLSAYYSHHRAEGSPHPEVIKLEDPIQIRTVDALTEAAGVPHERGQTEVIIPEKLRNYSKWVMSQKYQDRLKAGTSRTAAEPPQEHHRYHQAPIEQQPSAGQT